MQNNRPILTNNLGIDSIKDRYLYFTIMFKPFMESSDTPVFIHKLSQGN